MKENRLIIALLLFIVGCSSNGPDTSDVSQGSLNVNVYDAKTFNPNIDHGVIAKYEVTVEADDIDVPIKLVLEADAEGAVIEGVPAGSDRKVTIRAYNQNGMNIRMGESDGVEVVGGEVSDSEIEMNAVPIFTNVKNGSIIPNTRLKMQIFADPKNKLVLQSQYDESDNDTLFNISPEYRNESVIYNNDLFNYSPQILIPGKYEFQINDPETGYGSSVNITITDGEHARGAKLYSGGIVFTEDDNLKLSRIGYGYAPQSSVNTALTEIAVSR